MLAKNAFNRRKKPLSTQLTEFERGRVTWLREGGFSFRETLQKESAGMYPLFMIVGSTGQGTAARRPGSGRRRGTSGNEDRHIWRTTVTHRTVYAVEIRAAVSTTGTQRTVRNRLLQG
ncbi:transposable element Tc1 transposase [Trichonephila clavipes]|uniref:Transposable element Tc1 transposase n=1 Tax=Trichonephila clavipes TaxID=2585209 RepID=A0A8X6SQS6_TRICX|nr:transposable element Tc1 transposase [Trichonephila clavipes]